ncbi:MAG: TylF/MycF/NovP-related O-methyltransferase [Nevskiales bacterium]
MFHSLAQQLRRRICGQKAAEPDWDLASISAEDLRIIRRAQPYTMTGVMRIQGLIDAVRYCTRRNIPGAFAECGVWRGGSVLAMILTLQELGISDRDIWLYDTFEGMTAPTEHDTSFFDFDRPALEEWQEAQQTSKRVHDHLFKAEIFNEEGVRKVVLSTGYPEQRIHFVRGAVERTVPAQMPSQLALLRLDTDWYESTRHELTHMYPLIGSGGVLIIDDYGHWQGCRKAVDEYFSSGVASPVLLSRIDYTGRMAIKC